MMLCVLNGSGCVFYRPEDELARWTMGGSSSITSPPVYSLGVPTRETESGHERVCLSHISICPVMLGAGGALIEVPGAQQTPHTHTVHKEDTCKKGLIHHLTTKTVSKHTCSLMLIFFYIFFPLKIKSSKIWKKEKWNNLHSCCVFLEGKDISILKLVLKHEIIVLSNSCLVKTLL